MAVPSVPVSTNIKEYTDLTSVRVTQDVSEYVSSPPSIKGQIPDSGSDGFVVYPEGVLPSSLSKPFVRIRFKLDGLPTINPGCRIGIMTNCRPLNENGYYYGISLSQVLITKTIFFEGGSVAYNSNPIIPTPGDTDSDVVADWDYLQDWCYLDISFNELDVDIYLYDSTGDMKAQGNVSIQSSQVGTVGVFIEDLESGAIMPYIDDFYVSNISPYD